ncbi:hypothetical protein NP233_g6778 [Leucocoprinus birnbaumii]|uniref:Uncharacterized protein n=1 Tax=Leucocoprinus birnbaumii TaxID=56174 RepID=A0AAD5VTS2_9AGAR|nr:hypothetical protein NP233_g6778 [Leucocoprinus birnbaumii]
MLIPQPWPDRESLIDPSIDSLVIENLHRIRHLHLQTASVKWLSCTSELPSLTHFGFSPNPPSPNTSMYTFLRTNYPLASFSNSPHLHTLVLTGPGSYIDLNHGSNWSTITTLELSFLERSTCVNLLKLCSNVEVFRCRWHTHHARPRLLRGPIASGTPWSSPVIRQSLRILYWDMSQQTNHWELQMFRYLHIPAVQKLDLRIWNHSQVPNLREFCSRLSPSITSIHLSMLCPPSQPASDCILASFDPQLQTRELGVRSLNGLHAVHHTLQRMTDPKFLPNVERLRLFGRFPSPVAVQPSESLVLPKWCTELMLEIIQARLLSKRVEKFRFEFERLSVTWTPELRAQLRVLEDQTDGNFDIVQNDSAPDHPYSSLQLWWNSP